MKVSVRLVSIAPALAMGPVTVATHDLGVRTLRLILGAAVAMLTVGAGEAATSSAPKSKRFSLDCDSVATSQTRSSFGKKFTHGQLRRSQRFDIDPVARTVVVHWRTDGNNGWVDRPLSYSKVLFTHRGRIVFCQREDGSCEIKRFSDAGKTVAFAGGQIIIDVPKMTFSQWSNMTSNGTDGSWIDGTDSTTGTCRKVAA